MSLTFLPDCLYGAFHHTYQAALAILIISMWVAIFVHSNATIRTIDEAGQAFLAAIVIPNGFEYAPVASLPQRGVG